MSKYLLLIIALLGITACKSKKVLVKQQVVIPVTAPADLLKRNFFIKSDSADLEYKTFNAKGKIEIAINGSKHAATINIRIKKDQIIWAYINASFLPVAQAYITPDSIKVLNILQGIYTRKGFDFVRKYAGQRFDFKTLQAILTGNKPGSFISQEDSYKVLEAMGYQLSGQKDSIAVQLNFNQVYKPIDVDLSNVSQNQHLHVNYSNFFVVGNKTIPQSIAISSKVKTNDMNLSLSYKKVELNENLEFPFNPPTQ